MKIASSKRKLAVYVQKIANWNTMRFVLFIAIYVTIFIQFQVLKCFRTNLVFVKVFDDNFLN
jgi:hypothetical protein